MQTYLILGNIFSLLSAICIAISVLKKNKNDLIYWQVIDVIFCILSNIALYTYAALTTNSVALIRNMAAQYGIFEIKQQKEDILLYINNIKAEKVGKFLADNKSRTMLRASKKPHIVLRMKDGETALTALKSAFK